MQIRPNSDINLKSRFSISQSQLGAIHKWRRLKIGDFVYPYPPLYVISHLFRKPPPYCIKQRRLWMAHYKTHVSANIAILSCCMVIISWPIRPCLVQNQFVCLFALFLQTIYCNKVLKTFLNQSLIRAGEDLFFNSSNSQYR